MSDTLDKPTLPTFSWIGHLKDDDRELLSSYGEFFPGHPGTVIIEEGAMQTEVFVVISGKLEVHARQEDGSVALLAQIGPGETLGEISLFSPGPAAASVTAVEFSQLWRIADESLMEFMQENPGAGNLLLRTLATILAQRLRQMNPKAFGLSTYAVVDSPELAVQAPSAAGEDAPAEAAPTPPPLPPEARRAPPLDIPQTYQGKRISAKTQLIPTPEVEELEPIPPIIEAKAPPADELRA
ncbi:MAG TPA: cyclic nucleotide-binding domain-containing protein [Candidatus Methylacidiphilales bacterium]|jgi:CRP-like cAMP-binding protein|nr:cyclic nucleotide-binding domain-containing protein [Candidatus Methylacidiphilales bacterium]